MEEFAVIGLDTPEKKAEAEAILKELGYKGDKDWNDRYRQNPSFQVISRWSSGDYCYYVCAEDNETPITLDQLRAKVGKTEAVEEPKYPCMMEVWDDEGEVDAREVIAEFKTPDGDERYVAISEDGYNCYTWQHARPIQPDPLKTVLDILKYQVSKVDNEAKADIASWIGSMGVLLTPNEAQLILDALEKNEK